MTIRKVKTIFGSTVYIRDEELQAAIEKHRLVPVYDKDGQRRYREGEPVMYHPGNLLTDPNRPIVAYNPMKGVPGERPGRNYWYADDMQNGLPKFMNAPQEAA